MLSLGMLLVELSIFKLGGWDGPLLYSTSFYFVVEFPRPFSKPTEGMGQPSYSHYCCSFLEQNLGFLSDGRYSFKKLDMFVLKLEFG